MLLALHIAINKKPIGISLQWAFYLSMLSGSLGHRSAFNINPHYTKSVLCDWRREEGRSTDGLSIFEEAHYCLIVCLSLESFSTFALWAIYIKGFSLNKNGSHLSIYLLVFWSPFSVFCFYFYVSISVYFNYSIKQSLFDDFMEYLSIS